MKSFLLTAFCVVVVAGLWADQHKAVGVEGYDVVAYFTEGKAVKGEPEFTAEHEGVVYQFSGEEHRDAFVEEPEAYVPAYGGYCAYAVSRGYTAPVDPRAWTIHEDVLYLNYNRGVRRLFVKELEENIAKADRNWPGLSE